MKITTAPLVLSAATLTIARDSPGCGKAHESDGLSRPQSLISSGQNRTYSLNIPKDYVADDAHPVVFGFHGSPGTGLFFEVDTNMSNVTDKKSKLNKKITVFPDGRNGTWGRPNADDGRGLEGDLTFIHDILEMLREDYCVDNARIYATGHSAGGGMVNNLACNETVGGEFAAFAPVAGAYNGEKERQDKGSKWECKPARKTPILSMHGRDDTTVAYYGRNTTGRELPAQIDWFKNWVTRYSGDPKKDIIVYDDEAAVLYLFEGSYDLLGELKEQPTLRHIEISKWNHSWPSFEPNFSMKVANDEDAPLDATTEIQKFFAVHEISEKDLKDWDKKKEEAAQKGNDEEGNEKTSDGDDNKGDGDEKDEGGDEDSGSTQLVPSVALAAALLLMGALI